MNQKKIGKFIQERRKIKELTQLELAEKLSRVIYSFMLNLNKLGVDL